MIEIAVKHMGLESIDQLEHRAAKVMDVRLLQDKQSILKMKEMFYSVGCGCIATTIATFKHSIMVERYKTRSFGVIQEAYRDRDVGVLKQELGYLYAEKLSNRDIKDLYCYIETDLKLRKLYNYSKEGYMFTASLLHVQF